MRGFPRYLNTAKDYDNIQALFPPEQVEPEYKRLLDSKDVSIPDKKLAVAKDLAKGIEYELKELTAEDGKVEIWQYKKVQDPSCKLLSLGMKVADVVTLAKVDPGTVIMSSVAVLEAKEL